MEKVTLEKLREFEDIYIAIKWAEKQNNKYPHRRSKPTLPAKVDSKVAKQYAIDLEIWEKEKEVYSTEITNWKKKQTEINSVITEYIKDHAGLEIVPEKYRNKLYDYAFQKGHSGGFYEVYQVLSDLIDIFE